MATDRDTLNEIARMIRPWWNGRETGRGAYDMLESIGHELFRAGVVLTEPEDDPLVIAGRMYDPERHDPDSIFFDDSYIGPSERELMGGCNRCGGLDDCYCM